MSFLKGLQDHGMRVSAQLVERAKWHHQQALKFEEMAKRLDHMIPDAIAHGQDALDTLHNFEHHLRGEHE